MATWVQEFVWAADVGQHFNTVIPNDLLTAADHKLLNEVHELGGDMTNKTVDAFDALLERVKSDPRTTEPERMSPDVSHITHHYQVYHEG